MEIIEPSTPQEIEKYYDLRYEILRKPWNQPVSSNKDEWEDQSVHLLMLDDAGNAVAAGRLQINSEEEGQVRSMAVRGDWQGKGLGRKILKHIEILARERKMKHLVLDAREEAVGFYEKHGYTVIADSYFLFNAIRHYRMEKAML